METPFSASPNCNDNDNSSEKLIGLAVEEINNGEPELALDNLTNIRKDQPVRDRYLLSAVSTLAIGDTAKAFFYANAELIWFPTSIAALNLRGEIAKLLKADSLYDTQDISEDLSLLESEDLVAKGKELLLSGEAKKALAYLEKAALISPGLQNLNLLRARALFGLNRQGDADMALEAELELFPNNSEAMEILGERISQTFKFINDYEQPDCLMFSQSMLAGLELNNKGNRFIFEIAIEQSTSEISGDIVLFGDNLTQLLEPLQKIITHFSNSPKLLVVNPTREELNAANGLSLIYFGEGTNTCAEEIENSQRAIARLLPGGIVILNKANPHVSFIQVMNDSSRQNSGQYFWDETSQFKWFQKP